MKTRRKRRRFEVLEPSCMLAIAFDFASVDADESPGSGPNGEDVFAVQSGRSVRMGVYATADSPTELGATSLILRAVTQTYC